LLSIFQAGVSSTAVTKTSKSKGGATKGNIEENFSSECFKDVKVLQEPEEDVRTHAAELVQATTKKLDFSEEDARTHAAELVQATTKKLDLSEEDARTHAAELVQATTKLLSQVGEEPEDLIVTSVGEEPEEEKTENKGKVDRLFADYYRFSLTGNLLVSTSC
jgi:hypothetical protein